MKDYFGCRKHKSIRCLKHACSREIKNASICALLLCGIKKAVRFGHRHSFNIIYSIFNFLTHSYLAIIIFSFFFQKYVPGNIIQLIDSLSDPYLGILGIYLVLKEVKIRTGATTPHRFMKEAFVMSWIILLMISSLLTLTSQTYHVDGVYKLIVTNSLASIIIRIGTLFRY